jgi:hypothetical protein
MLLRFSGLIHLVWFGVWNGTHHLHSYSLKRLQWIPTSNWREDENVVEHATFAELTF